MHGGVKISKGYIDIDRNWGTSKVMTAEQKEKTQKDHQEILSALLSRRESLIAYVVHFYLFCAVLDNLKFVGMGKCFVQYVSWEQKNV